MQRKAVIWHTSRHVSSALTSLQCEEQMKAEGLGRAINGENENGWIGRCSDVAAAGVWGASHFCTREFLMFQ